MRQFNGLRGRELRLSKAREPWKFCYACLWPLERGACPKHGLSPIQSPCVACGADPMERCLSRHGPLRIVRPHAARKAACRAGITMGAEAYCEMLYQQEQAARKQSMARNLNGEETDGDEEE